MIIDSTKLILVITLLFSVSSATEPEINRAPVRYEVLSMGTNNCRLIKANYDKEQYQFLIKIWISGYLSALNSTLQNSHIGFSLDDRKNIIEGIREYCSEEKNAEGSFAEYIDTYWRLIVYKNYMATH